MGHGFTCKSAALHPSLTALTTALIPAPLPIVNLLPTKYPRPWNSLGRDIVRPVWESFF